MIKKIYIFMLLIGIISSCQPNQVTDIKSTYATVISPNVPSIYDYFDKSVKVSDIDIYSLESSKTGETMDKVKNNLITINSGEEIKISIYVRYSDGLSDKAFNIIYSVPNIVIIKDKKLIGLKEGKTVITVISKYIPDKKENLTVIVNPSKNTGAPNITTAIDNKEKIIFIFHSGNVATGQQSYISLINIDGTDLKKLSIGGSYNTLPVCSPDGKKVLFQAQDKSPSSFVPNGSKKELFVSNTDESNELRLSGNFYAEDAQWSLNSSQIVFSSNMTSDNTLIEKSEIYIMNPDGSNIKKITSNSFYDYKPAPSPDGKRIAFISKRNGKNNIYIINFDGTNETKLSYGDFVNITMPQWSPDSTKIVFASYNNFHDSKIFIVNTDSIDLKPLIEQVDVHEPRWSPDGKKILFYQNSQLNIMDYNGLDLKPFEGIYSFFYHWSPDGNKIVYSSSLGELFTINSDGTNQVMLSDNHGYGYYSPCWVK
jgi:Tol biopolymer transport system component